MGRRLTDKEWQKAKQIEAEMKKRATQSAAIRKRIKSSEINMAETQEMRREKER
jgi:hypothetical protein